MTDGAIRILIVEDHPLFRKGMRTLLSSVPDFDVVGEADNGSTAVKLAASLLPDVVLMDIQMPGMNGIAATKEIVAMSPSIKVLIVTLFEGDDSVFSALRAGAWGYVLKETDEEEMIRSIRRSLMERRSLVRLLLPVCWPFSPDRDCRPLRCFQRSPNGSGTSYNSSPRGNQIRRLLMN